MTIYLAYGDMAIGDKCGHGLHRSSTDWSPVASLPGAILCPKITRPFYSSYSPSCRQISRFEVVWIFKGVYSV